jgi:curved DNA-binding protein CbpA
MFRFFAQRYHPDNRETGDRERFDLVLEANGTLGNPLKRADYDLQHRLNSESRWRLAEQAGDSKGRERDVAIQNSILSILYAKRRQNMKDTGVGGFELERLLDCPAEHLEFHLWYLKEKGWLVRTENGTLAITMHGVDRVNSGPQESSARKLLTDQRAAEL